MGPISGAEIEFDSSQGGPSCPLCNDGYVHMPAEQFGGAGNTALATDEFGMAVLEVQGKRQEREIPDTARTPDREFTIEVAAQPEAITGDHIFDAFFAGFSSPNPFGLLQAVITALKTAHWDLGEFIRTPSATGASHALESRPAALRRRWRTRCDSPRSERPFRASTSARWTQARWRRRLERHHHHQVLSGLRLSLTQTSMPAPAPIG